MVDTVITQCLEMHLSALLSGLFARAVDGAMNPRGEELSVRGGRNFLLVFSSSIAKGNKRTETVISS